MALLILLHPLRVVRMLLQGVGEWLREEWERARGEWAGRFTHAEGIFPFLRILTNVVVRELQTIAILLDVYLGVPVIYSTFMQYDELAHHFGSTSRFALSDLRRTDARIGEIERMALAAGGRGYDLVILSDHGMTPSVSYRVRFRETLGTTVQRILDGDAFPHGRDADSFAASFAETSEIRRRRTARRESLRGVTHRVRGVARASRAARLGSRRVRPPRSWCSREVIGSTRARVGRGDYSSCLALRLLRAGRARARAGGHRAAMHGTWGPVTTPLREHPGIGAHRGAGRARRSRAEPRRGARII
jgi:hypothetical protein